MFGLKNKLVLCPNPNCREGSFLSRRVIIPQGEVSFGTDGDFTNVSINTSAERHVRWHEYTVDTDLGRLKSNTSLRSKLYLCYLHALTSHCLPDPLLGHTGTEEALSMLRSAACRSFQRLDGDDAKLLELIGNLTPDRLYHPPHLQLMATVKWNRLPALSQHHDFYRDICAILDHAHALEALYDQSVVFNIPTRDQLLLDRAASRNMSYHPSDLQIHEQSLSLDDIEYRSRDVPDSATVENVAYRTSWSIWNDWSLDGRLPGLWDLMSTWGSLGPASGEVLLHYSRYWLEFDAKLDWFVIYNLCRHAGKGGIKSMKVELSFCLSAAAYSNSKYADAIPYFVAIAMDEHCRDLDPPPHLSYTLSDGITRELTRLESPVSETSLPIESIPWHSLTIKEMNSTDIKTQRREKYKSTIRKESSRVASSIFHRPDYSFVDFPENWFNEYECRRSIKEYEQSISRNRRLRDHVQLLESYLQRYRKDHTRLTLPYKFSPNFITNNLRAPPYSIREVLLSRTDVPTPSADADPSPFRVPPEAGSDNLEILIKEFRKSSEPLLQLYGGGLSKSHCKWLGQGPVPSHKFLSFYHNQCSQRKKYIFFEILATLSPSKLVDKTSGIAGLWPRITPRSILSQLAQNRIDTVPDQWKIVITRYAVAVLKYQQSIRLLELLELQKHEEFLREIEAIRKDVLVESTPDWLLIQVSPLRRRRSDCVRLT